MICLTSHEVIILRILFLSKVSSSSFLIYRIVKGFACTEKVWVLFCFVCFVSCLDNKLMWCRRKVLMFSLGIYLGLFLSVFLVRFSFFAIYCCFRFWYKRKREQERKKITLLARRRPRRKHQHTQSLKHAFPPPFLFFLEEPLPRAHPHPKHSPAIQKKYTTHEKKTQVNR